MIGKRSFAKYIIDTNIWVNINNGKLVPLVNELGLELIFLKTQLEEELPRFNWKGDLIAEEMEIGDKYTLDMLEDKRLSVNYPDLKYKIGIVDVHLLLLAKSTSATLLTGDKELRKLCKDYGVDTEGFPWILRRLFEQRLSTPNELRKAVRKNKKNGSRLPYEEIYKELDAWELEEGISVKEHKKRKG